VTEPPRLSPEGERVLGHKEILQIFPRQAVLNALEALSDRSWLVALSAAYGVIAVMGDVVEDDPTPNGRAVAAMKAEIQRLEQP